jgi:outer membrane protein assembly factor BamB
MYRILAILAVMACVIGLMALPANNTAWAESVNDWEQFQNDLYNSGVTTSPAPLSSVTKGWKVQVGHTDPAQMAAGVNNTPLVADGKVLVIGALADTWLLDAKTGQTVWTKQLSSLKQDFQLATPVYSSGMYFVATNDGHVYALAAGDGAEIWKKDLFQYAVDAGLSTCSINTLRDNAQLNSPLKYDKGKIYLGVWGTSQTDLNYYFCLNAANGEVLWQREVTSGKLGYYWSGPCVIGDYLLYGDQNNYITCVNKTTGATVSEIKLTDIDPNGYWVRCSVTYSPETGCVYFGDEHGHLWAFDFDNTTGQLAHRWHKKLGGLINSTPAIYNGRLYVGTNLYTKQGDLFCLDAATGDEIWKFTPEMKSGDDSSGYYSEPGIQASPTIYVKGGHPYIYFTTNCAYATVYCLNENGQKVWEFENDEAGLSEGYSTCSIAVSDGWVYFGNDGGYVYGLTAAGAADTTPPVITLNGAASMTLAVGDSFTDPGAAALDDVDGDISDRIVVGGDTVDANTAGTYTITYNVTDTAGNPAAEVTRAVNVKTGGSETNPTDKISVFLSIEDMYGKQRFSGQVEVSAGADGKATVLAVMFAAEDLDPDIAMVYDPDNPYITGGYISSMYGQDSPWGERSDGWIYYVGGDYKTGRMPDRGVGYWRVKEGEKIYWYWGTMAGRQPLAEDEITDEKENSINKDEALEKIKEAKAKGLKQIEEIITETVTLPQEVIKELIKEKMGVIVRLENKKAGLIVPTEALSGKNDLVISVKALKRKEAEPLLKTIPAEGKALTDVYDFSMLKKAGANTEKISWEQSPVIILSYNEMEVAENTVLAVYYYNEENGQWEKVENIEIDKENKEVEALPSHLSKFVLAQMSPAELPVYPAPAPSFSDVGEDHWAKSDIDFMVNKELIAGYPDGAFKPDKPVTRAEFTSLLARVLSITEAKGNIIFSDVQLSDWHSGAIAAAYQKGLVTGYDTGCFYPDNLVTREEAAVILINALRYQGKISDRSPDPAELEKLNDQEAISPWARDAVAQTLRENLLHGFEDGSFRPRESTTRAQAVSMLRHLLSASE